MKRRRYVCLGLLLVAACAKTKQVGDDLAWELGPVGSREVNVVSVDVIGPYILATLRGRRIDLRFFAPASETCAKVLVPEARLTYAKQGIFGRFSREGESCDPVGTASLAAWRNRQPRSRGTPNPRGTARFQTFYEDEDVVLVRGRFPHANRILLPSGVDLVAMLPKSEACERPIERGEASLEFRDTGSVPFRLIGANASCPIEGFALPADPGSREG